VPVHIPSILVPSANHTRTATSGIGLVNLCVEGILDAMDAPGDYDIPILNLHNRVKGKTFLTSKAVMTIVGAMFPEICSSDCQA
jgi:hypothetical protein